MVSVAFICIFSLSVVPLFDSDDFRAPSNVECSSPNVAVWLKGGRRNVRTKRQSRRHASGGRVQTAPELVYGTILRFCDGVGLQQ